LLARFFTWKVLNYTWKRCGVGKKISRELLVVWRSIDAMDIRTRGMSFGQHEVSKQGRLFRWNIYEVSLDHKSGMAFSLAEQHSVVF